MVRMTVRRVVMNQQGNASILLVDEQNERLLPIWIGTCEAHAIAMKLENETFERPLTHDLFANTLDELGYALERIEVTRLENKVFFATLHVVGEDGAMTIDSRPSDAIGLAERVGAGIYVASEVLDRAQILRSELGRGTDEEQARSPEEIRKFQELLDSVDLPEEGEMPNAGEAGEPDEDKDDGDSGTEGGMESDTD